ncbi:MAG: type III secretion inner membrane ring lipoprotein SctJ [Endozoicomonadaceae bacterium]|nr:type III secretion inner membrane ring lipoprotein SctJ [Endozoicomonadaceae bacterium]
MTLKLAKMVLKLLIMTAVVLLVAGCKTPIYHHLNEMEANKMLALLLDNNVAVSKQMDSKGVSVTLMVEESQVVKALDILHNNGYPRKSYVTIDEIFPPGQLITSPEQQRVKMVYAEEQQLDEMLASIPGVITAHAQINEHLSNDVTSLTNKEIPPSAAVLIIYSAQQKMDNYLLQIRDLIKNSVPGLTEENLSVVLIPNKPVAPPRR